jgi:release factor glutamine methyltransferase
MTLLELKNKFLADLTSLYPKEEVLSFYSLLLEFKLGLSKVDLALNPNQVIELNNLNYFFDALKDLQAEKPIQYIIGETEFYGLPFKVNEDVLIPRPETEELVEWVLKEKRQETEDGRQETGDKKKQTSEFKLLSSKLDNQQSALNIVDIGTGSGCIAISLAKHLPNATVFALDISAKALQIAKQNATLNMVNVRFIEHDILNSELVSESLKKEESVIQSVAKNLKFDIIVSNPPYVRHLEKQEMTANVLQNEPHLALFVENENPLLFYDKIADFAKNNLTKNGELYFEINQFLGKETLALLQNKGFTNIELKKDVFGNDRMVKARFSSNTNN